MSHDHNHLPAQVRHEKPLWWALGLTSTFLLVEVGAAFWTNSLALLSDAAHMATDTLALVIALVAVRLSRRPPDAKRTYGYARLEALGACVNGALLFVVAAYILWEAQARFREPQAIASGGMLLVAVIGLVINLIAMRLLQAGAGESLNVKGAYLEVWSDMLGSVAVIIGALLIRFTGWQWVDAVLAILIGLWVLPRTWVLLREALNVLLEGVPKGLSLAQVRAAMEAQAGVDDLHDLHVWALASNTPALTAHVVVAAGHDDQALRRQLAELLHARFGIDHITLQLESAHCGDACGAASRQASFDGYDHDTDHDHRHDDGGGERPSTGADAHGHYGHVHR